ncbi:hypothetical protein PENCOP_c014G00648 [Penicillium coprophilum]|uniref:Uncharacterized protein n=1 Tax=Penicillium coprophilum TaxID=36646 RepID=A0A1V6U9Q6_9EURO|nr:hypothetical protein PENCOP_c014G00648 [Penicillium coprophilum]
MNCEPHVAALVCAENIALNYLLHEVPEPPQPKPTERVRGSEKELVEVLSFLAKTKDGSDYIPAMCVEQDLNERGSSTEITKQLLEMIVQMCSSRIAPRLRLTGKKWGNSKASIKDILHEAIEGTRQIHPQKLIRSNLEESLSIFRAESNSVIQSVNEWSNHRVSPSGPTEVIKQAAFTVTLLNIYILDDLWFLKIACLSVLLG